MVFKPGNNANPIGRAAKRYEDENLVVTAKWLIARTNEARRLAIRQKQPGAAVQALLLLAELHAKRQATQPNDEDAIKPAQPIARPPTETHEQYMQRLAPDKLAQAVQTKLGNVDVQPEKKAQH